MPHLPACTSRPDLSRQTGSIEKAGSRQVGADRAAPAARIPRPSAGRSWSTRPMAARKHALRSAAVADYRRRAGLLTGLLLLALSCLTPHRPAWAGSATPSPNLPSVREGYRRYQGVCSHCHGPDGVGSSFGPALIAPLASYERFAAAVLEGVSGPRGVMRGFAGDPNVEPYLDAIYAYLAERASGRLGRGRPGAGADPSGR
jgi:mono/diheme cytochrome c family protein